MSSVAAVASPAPQGAERLAGETLTAEVISGLAGAERIWREAETNAISSSPYQRFDWVQAFADTVSPGADFRLAAIRDQRGAPVLLLPLLLERRAGLRIATGIGGKHANFYLPFMAPRARPGSISSRLIAFRQLGAGSRTRWRPSGRPAPATPTRSGWRQIPMRPPSAP
jgi:CelD/BcsL family acetyltransferase involved in cellulose biosynthesis